MQPVRPALAAALALLAFPAGAHGASRTFMLTGAPEQWTVPAGVDRATFELLGAQGGNSVGGTTPQVGGKGAKVTQTLIVSPGQVFTINVGGVGIPGVPHASYNGGAAAGNASDAGRGGGASDVRLGPDLGNRVLVAAGGGGGGRGGAGGNSGAIGGGGPSELGSSESTGGGPGTASAGGKGGSAGPYFTSHAGYDGSLGHGGGGRSPGEETCAHPPALVGSGGGGGGGLHGGGGGAAAPVGTNPFLCFGGAAGGGGGSSLIHFGGTLADGVNEGSGRVVITWTAPGGGGAPVGGGGSGTVPAVPVPVGNTGTPPKASVAAPTITGSSSAGTAKPTTAGAFTIPKQLVDCSGPGPDCVVTTGITGIVTTSKKRKLKLGGSTFKVKSGKRGSVRVKLSKTGRKLLKRKRRLPVTVTTTIKRGPTTIKRSTKITLKAR